MTDAVRPRAGGPAGPLWTENGLRAERLVPPNRLWASNGVAFGPDGRLYVAQFLGATVSALDVHTGRIETVLGPDGPLTAPDDLVFDDDGALFVVDLPAGLVWRRDADGSTAVVTDGIAAPDGIAWHRGRLFVNELTPDGRLLEIDLDDGGMRVLATGLVLGNAMQVGPDGLLYYPHLGSGEVWRVDPDGGPPERLVSGLDRPVAVRFDPARRLRVLSNGEQGRLWTLTSGGRISSAVDTGVDGADNVAFAADGTAYVSGAFHGGIVALAPDGTLRTVVDPGLNGPFGIAAGPDGITVADHFGLATVRPGAAPHAVPAPLEVVIGARGITAHAGELHLSTGFGAVHSGRPGTGWRTRVTGLDRPGGIAADADGALLVVESGGGRLLRVGPDDRVVERTGRLHHPVDVAVDARGRAFVTETVDARGRAFVTETEGGRVVRVDDGAVVAAGLARPEGLAAAGGHLWCTEAGTGRLWRIDPDRRTGAVVASGLAFDVRPPHVPRDSGNGLARRPDPFAAVEPDGDALLVGLTAEGSLLRVGPVPR